MMKMRKKMTAALLAGVMILGLAGCSVPTAGFADYDVSGYVKALLDSSYHNENEDLMRISGIGQADAETNNATTVENAAVTFCNTYSIAPGEDQLRELQAVMKQAFALTRYTVKDERRVDGGYYLEVEVAPINNFVGREADIEKLKEEAETEALTDPAAQANRLFVEKALEFCKRELANISYDADTRTIALDVRQTEQGELQLNMDQIETIDRTVVRFS